MRFESGVRRRRMSKLFQTESQRSPWTLDAILKQVLFKFGEGFESGIIDSGAYSEIMIFNQLLY